MDMLVSHLLECDFNVFAPKNVPIPFCILVAFIFYKAQEKEKFPNHMRLQRLSFDRRHNLILIHIQTCTKRKPFRQSFVIN